jgi:hypothetical protein
MRRRTVVVACIACGKLLKTTWPPKLMHPWCARTIPLLPPIEEPSRPRPVAKAGGA